VAGSSCPGTDRSEVLDTTCHLFGFVRFPDQEQTGDDLSDASGLLMTEGDPSMLESTCVPTQEILVLGEDNPARRHAVTDVLPVSSLA
jgi:hypothetical protein